MTDVGLNADELRQKHVIESDFDQLEHFFFAQSASPKRLKADAFTVISTAAAVRSLGIVYALRSLELAEGIVLLIEEDNVVTALPGIRSIYEVLFAILYTQGRFSECIEFGEPDRFSETARRLLSAKSSGGPAGYPIPVGKLKSKAFEVLHSLDKKFLTSDPEEAEPSVIAKHLDQMYSELSDGTHPTQWSTIMYTSERADGLGIDWQRKPEGKYPLVGALVHLALPLGLIRRFIVNLPRLAAKAESP